MSTKTLGHCVVKRQIVVCRRFYPQNSFGYQGTCLKSKTNTSLHQKDGFRYFFFNVLAYHLLTIPNYTTLTLIAL